MRKMLYTTVPAAFLLSACSSLPQLYNAAEDVADDTAVKVELSKECFAKETDVHVNVEILNKEQVTK
jgi:starvation-inducible outer membrane lipoprotein